VGYICHPKMTDDFGSKCSSLRSPLITFLNAVVFVLLKSFRWYWRCCNWSFNVQSWSFSLFFLYISLSHLSSQIPMRRDEGEKNALKVHQNFDYNTTDNIKFFWWNESNNKKKVINGDWSRPHLQPKANESLAIFGW